MNLKVAVIAVTLIALSLILYASWKGGYEAALEDVRNGNVRVHTLMN